ncbi:MAG: hypothetical protein GXO30_03925 [Epsilonproteobacteria bacterium]|nr:hypothetical protein [Campylobacterota bacterium]
MSSDGNITIKKDEFSEICIESTNNSLYGLSQAKVCWVVLKENNTLVRVEGNSYSLPLGLDDNVEADKALDNLEVFDVYRSKDSVLVIAKQRAKNPIAFAVYGVSTPQKKKPKKRKKKSRKSRKKPRHKRRGI